MAELSWRAATDGRYWIDVNIAAQPVRVMIDLGLVDPAHAIGFEVDPDFYDQSNLAGQVSLTKEGPSDGAGRRWPAFRSSTRPTRRPSRPNLVETA